MKLDYYDPRRQDSIAEHDCVFEDGAWWFGHGMPCKHPQLHTKPNHAAEFEYAQAFWHDEGPLDFTVKKDRAYEGEELDEGYFWVRREVGAWEVVDGGDA